MIANLLPKRTILYTIMGVLLGIIIGGLGLFSYIELKSQQLEKRIFPNVFIDNKNVGNLTKEQAASLFEIEKKPLENIEMNVLYKNEQIATLSAETINLRSNIDEVIDRAYLIGRSSHLPSVIRERLSSLLNIEQFRFTSQVIYDQGAVDEFLNTAENTYNIPAKNALFEFVDNKVTTFKPDEKGQKINSDQFKQDFEKAVLTLKSRPVSQKILLTDTVIDPEITLAKANSFGIEEKIGEGTSNYTHSIPTRIHNVILGAKKFHGVLVPKGSVFSFVEIIGDISAATGYQPAYVIKNGKTVLGDGGGICQVSTTMFRAALNTGLPIEERNAHAYRVGYYENDSKPGLDATIFSPTVDFKFKNDTPASILIQTEIDEENMILTFKFYGKKDNRKVELTEPVLWDVAAAPPPLYQDDPTIPKGTTKQVDFAAAGGKAKFNYRVTKVDGQIYEKEFYSNYRPWQAVFLVGTAG